MNSFSLSVLQTVLIAGFSLTLAGCEVGPDYKKPEAATPSAWVSDEEHQASDKAIIDQQWWKNFNDPILTQLIDKTASNNFDLQIAEARIAQARAGVSSSSAALLPTGDVKGTATREANQLAFPDAGSTGLGPLLKKPFNIFQTGFDASWEMDLFGAKRRAEEDTQAQLQASEASRDDIRVSLMAEVARTYVTLRSAQAQLANAQAIVTSNKNTLEIAQQRFAVGDVARLDVTQAEAALQQSQAQLPDLRNQVAQAQFSLDVLMGEQPGTARALTDTPTPIPAANASIALAAPSSVIAQRPDIRIAERKLAAATAQQGVAVAKFFPDISISGFFGALSTTTSKLITSGNQSWMAGGSVIWPILNYGTLSANLDAANAQQQEAMATYRKSIIGALSDVEKSLSSYSEQQKLVQETQSEVDQDKRARAAAEERFKAGSTSRLDALTAERVFLQAQNRLIMARADETQNLIALYKSLGGGWAKN